MFMDSVMKLNEGDDAFKNVNDAIKFMHDTNFTMEVTVYDISDDDAYNKTKEIYKEIKKFNVGKPLNDQILPTNPFKFRGMVGCLGVQAYTIGLGTYERNHESLAIFSGYNSSVLDESTEIANVQPGLKARMSMMMLSHMILHGKE